ncbi:hypothetical protein QZH41_012544 [Actinostola sp. cb2023]|nr:hypothetical protein QZH41_012544 [Actinostola sp. cb2023]
MEIKLLQVLAVLLACFWQICTSLQRLYTASDFMLFESNSLVYFEILSPEKLRYIFKVRPAKDFGSIFKLQFGRVRLVAAEPLEACQPITNSLALNGAIALVNRGGCSFVSKSKMAEQSGAVAVFIADNAPDNADAMVDMVHDGTERVVQIPVGYLLGSDGYHIREAIKDAHASAAIISIPVNVTTTPDLYTRQPPWSYW